MTRTSSIKDQVEVLLGVVNLKDSPTPQEIVAAVRNVLIGCTEKYALEWQLSYEDLTIYGDKMKLPTSALESIKGERENRGVFSPADESDLCLCK